VPAGDSADLPAALHGGAGGPRHGVLLLPDGQVQQPGGDRLWRRGGQLPHLQRPHPRGDRLPDHGEVDPAPG